MKKHFLFHEGEWRGAGVLHFSSEIESIEFQTHWSVSSLQNKQMRAVQTVDIPGQPSMINVFTVTKKRSGDFDVVLENEHLGIFGGQGVSDPQQVAWEFAHYGALEGFEVYERKENDSYSFRAEYLGSDGIHTNIHGTIAKESITT